MSLVRPQIGWLGVGRRMPLSESIGAGGGMTRPARAGNRMNSRAGGASGSDVAPVVNLGWGGDIIAGGRDRSAYRKGARRVGSVGVVAAGLPRVRRNSRCCEREPWPQWRGEQNLSAIPSPKWCVKCHERLLNASDGNTLAVGISKIGPLTAPPGAARR
ncbi:hypothetical protein VTI74DRAFT_2018 [Chaetomium olivicolor]